MNNQPISCNALVDSGSDLSVISQEFLEQIGAITLKLSTPLQLEVIDGSILESGIITHYTFLSLIYNKYPFHFKFYVVQNLHSPIILGLDWLQTYNPKINWKHLSLKWRVKSNNAK